jgi:DNA-binding response OmpR family regulator
LREGLAIDLVILDHNMPGLSGAETLPRLLKVRPDLQILVTTGFQDTELRLLLAKFRSVLALPKPFSIVELRGVLQGVCSRFPSMHSATMRRTEDTDPCIDAIFGN